MYQYLQAMKHIREFEDRVFAIALTDSVHSFKQQEATPEVKEFYLEVSCLVFFVSPAKQKRDICTAFPVSSLWSSAAAA